VDRRYYRSITVASLCAAIGLLASANAHDDHWLRNAGLGLAAAGGLLFAVVNVVTLVRNLRDIRNERR